MAKAPSSVLVIACGALAREITALVRANRWHGLAVRCLPAELHNRPEKIPEAVRAEIRRGRSRFASVFVAYGDCGTAGRLDRVLAEEGVERIAGADCYEFYAGREQMQQLAEREPGTFYLTDFLARHFERLVVVGLGLDRHPELESAYFGNYRRLVYLSQSCDNDLLARARRAAERLHLEFEHCHTGYGGLEQALRRAQESRGHGEVDHGLLA